jgi:molecular chaperone GrpE
VIHIKKQCGKDMSKLKIELNDGNVTEKTSTEIDNQVENGVGETDAVEDSNPTNGQDVPVEHDSTQEKPETSADAASESSPTDETLDEWIDTAIGGEESQDSTENDDDEAKNWPNKGQDKKITELEAQLVDLTTQLADARDQLLRKAADFENFRKRMNQEKQGAIEFANQTLLLDIIPVIDDFERALLSAETSAELVELPAGKALLDGIAMIEKRLVSQLESKWGLKRFNSAGEPFDPNRHEAMMMEKSPDVEEPMVKEDFAKGYTLKDRVIRAAKVKVLMPQEEGSGE